MTNRPDKFGTAALVAAVLGILLPRVTAYAGDGDWQGVNIASFASIEDFATLKAHGLNVVLVNVTHDPAQWAVFYSAADKHGLKLIPMIWSVHQTAWQWNEPKSEWELNAGDYPASVGAKFLAFLRADPKRLDATFAVYAFHEPHNPETPGGLVPAERQRKFWRQIHEDQFPGRKLQIYGESVAWHRDTRNGCVDYDGWSLLYPFVRIDGRPAYRPYHWNVGKGLGGVEQWPGPPTTQAEPVKENYRQVIDSLHELIQGAAPAPDGSRTRLVVLMQTYAIDSRNDLWNRMPTAAEIRDWGADVVGRRMQKLAGLNWYCYRKAANFYTHCLADHPKDENGEDRLAAIRQVAETLAARRPTSQPEHNATEESEPIGVRRLCPRGKRESTTDRHGTTRMVLECGGLAAALADTDTLANTRRMFRAECIRPEGSNRSASPRLVLRRFSIEGCHGHAAARVPMFPPTCPRKRPRGHGAPVHHLTSDEALVLQRHLLLSPSPPRPQRPPRRWQKIHIAEQRPFAFHPYFRHPKVFIFFIEFLGGISALGGLGDRSNTATSCISGLAKAASKPPHCKMWFQIKDAS